MRNYGKEEKKREGKRKRRGEKREEVEERQAKAERSFHNPARAGALKPEGKAKASSKERKAREGWNKAYGIK